MKKVKYFDNVNEACEARALLESEGIEVVLFNGYVQSIDPRVSMRPSSRPYLMVREEDYERAVELMGELQKA